MRKRMKPNNLKSRKDGKIFDLSVFGISKTQLLTEIQRKISHNQTTFLVTLNPEIVLQAQKDQKYFDVLHLADYLVADGIGIASALEYNALIKSDEKVFQKLIKGLHVGFSTVFRSSSLVRNWVVIKGRNLMLDLCRLADKHALKVFLIGGENDVAEKACISLRERFPNVVFEYDEGPFVTLRGVPIDKVNIDKEKNLLRQITVFRPNMVFVAFGAPKQEFWIVRNLKSMQGAFIVGVGGSFDYIAGRSKLPPKIFNNFEFLWRLVHQPILRGRRIAQAVIVFPYKVFKESL